MLVLVTPPAIEPLTTSEAKAHLRVTSSSEDALIDAIVKAARTYVEKYTGRKLINQTWDLWLDSFPGAPRAGAWFDGERDGTISSLVSRKNFITIATGPVSAVSFFKTYGTDDAAATFSSSSYFADTKNIPARVGLNYGATWPSATLRPLNGIQIRFIAGYGTSSASIPDDILAAIKLLVGHWFENRETVQVGTAGKELDLTLNSILSEYQLVEV